MLPSIDAMHLGHWQTAPLPVLPSTMHIKLDAPSITIRVAVLIQKKNPLVVTQLHFRVDLIYYIDRFHTNVQRL